MSMHYLTRSSALPAVYPKFSDPCPSPLYDLGTHLNDCSTCPLQQQVFTTDVGACAQRFSNTTFSSRSPSLPILSRMSSCPFCDIATNYPPSTSIESDHELTSPPAFVVLSTPLCMAFLDIMPLSQGHMLVTTRKHHEKISDVTEEEASELGAWLPRLSRVLANATGVWDWNIVQNNGKAPSARKSPGL